MNRARHRHALSLALALFGACTSPPPDTKPDAPAGNHLAAEKSPYLLRHAQNPVDWYPWGPEAFEKARRENKPIFLSIGYAACHWCHVMEAESFSNTQIAALMNRSFVAVKVDREERPDIDRIYLAYVASVNGGGWPMSVVLTPDLQPFFGATYLPPETRGTEEGLTSILTRLAGDWQTRRGVLLKAAADGTTVVSGLSEIPKPSATAIDAGALDETFASLTRSFDRANGGFAGAPKFPRPVVLTFLLRYYARTGARPALDMTLTTLRAMDRGGIHDQLGGGFHRYAVDAEWREPHFEKMLYDQAQLAVAYAEAFQVTRAQDLATTARTTIDYAIARLRDPEGGFHSAEDADSAVSATDARLAEGAFYLWSAEDAERALGAQAPPVVHYFNLIAGYARPLVARATRDDTARKFDVTPPELAVQIELAKERMRIARTAWPRPAVDDKVVTAWNGLMISALARAAAILDEPRYLTAARDTARFIEARLFDSAAGSLKRRYRDGSAAIDGLLEDYAFLAQGLLDLFEATFDPHWLTLALQLQRTQDRLFWDDANGAYFSTRADAAHLLARAKEDYDGAEPSANSVSAMNLLRAWQITGDDVWRRRAEDTFRALSGRVTRSGTAVPQLMSALAFRESTPKQIVIAGDPGAADTAALLRLVHDRFIPNKVVMVVDGATQQAALAQLAPQIAEMTRRNGGATIYVCEHYTCQLPTNDAAVAARLLDQR